MANCYGTEQHAKFRQEQLALGNDGEWKLEEERTERYGDYELKYTTYSSSLKTDQNFIYNHAELNVYRNGKLIYTCSDIYEDQPTFFYFYTRQDNDYLMFRKDDLYGYTILNLNTLNEHNYFPDVVLNREQERFIIVEATLWNDILLLYGCYWAFPYMYFVLDLNTYKTHLLSQRATEEKTEIQNDKLTLHFYDDEQPKTQTYSYENLEKLLKESKTYDI